ncbi:MAG TPA: hypothetical protein VHE61_01940 [Opitutaceae bacterium]|nr:hypothetical protein [Opitutaceae bacterium]
MNDMPVDAPPISPRQASARRLAGRRGPLGVFLRRCGWLVSLKRAVGRWWGGPANRSALDVLGTFPMYSPNMDGPYRPRAAVTIHAIRRLPAALAELGDITGATKCEIIDAESFCRGAGERARLLKLVFDRFGSNKANFHNYHFIYAAILKRAEAIETLLEIGLGTNHADVLSNMGPKGVPGASLRAFRHYLKTATIYGADVDRRILFNEERIRTFFVDQTEWSSLEALGRELPEAIDIIVDDGLHAHHANVQTLRFGLSRVKRGGWVIIEDIRLNSTAIWKVVSALIPASFKSYLITGEYGAVFAVQRLE